jgi:sodium transport system permease protein
MNALRIAWTVLCKELLDLGRDHRTLLISLLLMPLLYPLLLLGMGMLQQQRIASQLEVTLDVPVLGGEQAPNLIDYLAAQGLRAVDPPADLDAAIASQQVDVALRIDRHYASDWHAGRPALVEILSDSTRRAADIPAQRLQKALAGYSQQVGALRLLARGLDPQLAQPLAVASQDLASAEARRNVLLSALLPILLIISSFVGGAYLILDATAGERERQSLEPLLATPASRAAIVSGKIAAACVIGLASLLLTLLAFKLGAALSSSSIGRQLNVGLLPILQMLLVLLPMLFIGTALLTWLAACIR